MALTRLGLNQSINLATNITGTLATGNGGTGATSFAPGKVLQVINATDSTEKVVASSTYVDTGLSATITPSSSSNKIFVMVSLAVDNNESANSTRGRITRTIGGTETLLDEGASAGSSDRASFDIDQNNGNHKEKVTMSYLDSQ